jgi:hypothetical protein
MRGEPLRWFDDNADNPPFLKALEESTEGDAGRVVLSHVRAIIVAIDSTRKPRPAWR